MKSFLNALGSSAGSASRSETIVFRPSKPLNVAVTRKTGDPTGLTINWDASSDNGGSVIDKYKCEAFNTGTNAPVLKTSEVTGATTLDLLGFTSGQQYDIMCYAANDGTNYGEPSTLVTSPIVGAAPSAPSLSNIEKATGEGNDRKIQLTLNVVPDSVPAVDTYSCKDGSDTVVVAETAVNAGDNTA